MDTRLGYISLPLEVDGAEIPQGRVSACRIIEAFDLIEHLGLCLISRAKVLRAIRSVFCEVKKRSVAALSHALPERLIEQLTQLSAIRPWNCSLVCLLP
jgi:hypothetical protein